MDDTVNSKKDFYLTGLIHNAVSSFSSKHGCWDLRNMLVHSFIYKVCYHLFHHCLPQTLGKILEILKGKEEEFFENYHWQIKVAGH